MNQQRKKKAITYIALDLMAFQEEPLQSVAQQFGCHKAWLFMAVCLLVIDKGEFAASLSFVDLERLSNSLGVSMEQLECWLRELIAGNCFNKHLYEHEGVLTNEFIQKGLFRASYRARKKHVKIPLDMLCLGAKWRREYRLALSRKLDNYVVQCINTKEYKDTCAYHGGEDTMNRLIARGGRLLQYKEGELAIF